MDTRLQIASEQMSALLRRDGGVLGTTAEIESDPARLAALAELSLLAADYLIHLHETIDAPPSLALLGPREERAAAPASDEEPSS